MAKRPPKSWTSDEFFSDLDELNATDLARIPALLARDEPVIASMRLDLLEHVDLLLKKYPDHPELLDRRAPLCDDAMEKLAYMEQAILNAHAYGMPAYEMRIRHAHRLIYTLMDCDAAEKHLDVAQQEMAALGVAPDSTDLSYVLKELQETKNGEVRCRCGSTLKNLKEPACPGCGENWRYDSDISEE